MKETYLFDDLVETVTEKTGLKKKDVHDTLKSGFDSIQEALGLGMRVKIVNFGSWHQTQVGSREGRVPSRTGELSDEVTTIPKYNRTFFRAATKTKSIINA